MSTKPKILSPTLKVDLLRYLNKFKLTVPYCLLRLACLQGFQELPVMSAWVSREAAAPCTEPDTTMILQVQVPSCEIPPLLRQHSLKYGPSGALIFHGISKLTQLALTFWPVLSSESKIHHKGPWSHGGHRACHKKIIHRPFSWKACFGCLFQDF